jgi:hypothetical protein
VRRRSAAINVPLDQLFAPLCFKFTDCHDCTALNVLANLRPVSGAIVANATCCHCIKRDRCCPAASSAICTAADQNDSGPKPGGHSSNWGRWSVISYQGAFEPTKIWASGRNPGSPVTVPSVTQLNFPPSATAPKGEPH